MAIGDELVSEVPTMQGKGVSVELPTDIGKVINNVVKPFGNNEINRQRATQILDFIIAKKKSDLLKVEKKQERKKELEEKILMKILEKENVEMTAEE